MKNSEKLTTEQRENMRAGIEATIYSISPTISPFDCIDIYPPSKVTMFFKNAMNKAINAWKAFLDLINPPHF